MEVKLSVVEQQIIINRLLFPHLSDFPNQIKYVKFTLKDTNLFDSEFPYWELRRSRTGKTVYYNKRSFKIQISGSSDRIIVSLLSWMHDSIFVDAYVFIHEVAMLCEIQKIIQLVMQRALIKEIKNECK
jgi:hypothetical protein